MINSLPHRSSNYLRCLLATSVLAGAAPLIAQIPDLMGTSVMFPANVVARLKQPLPYTDAGGATRYEHYFINVTSLSSQLTAAGYSNVVEGTGADATANTLAMNKLLQACNGERYADGFMSVTFYFPPNSSGGTGIYKFNNTLCAAEKDVVLNSATPTPVTLEDTNCGVRFRGAGRGKTILRLMAGSFPNAGTPQSFIRLGTADDKANTGFGNYVEHLTLQIDDNNQGAVGIEGNISNCGSISYVDIKRGAGVTTSASVGLLFQGPVGPAFVKNVRVIGAFKQGITCDFENANQLTFENITLDGFTEVGFLNTAKNIQIMNMLATTTSDAMGFCQIESAAFTVMLNATFKTTFSAPTRPAIYLGADEDSTDGTAESTSLSHISYLFARNLKNDSGSTYTQLIDSNHSVTYANLAAGSSFASGSAQCWQSRSLNGSYRDNGAVASTQMPAATTGASSSAPLTLPSAFLTPQTSSEYWSELDADWQDASEGGTGATPRAVGGEYGPVTTAGSNDKPALTACLGSITSGAKIVYFPTGIYDFSGIVDVNSIYVRTLEGCFSRMNNFGASGSSAFQIRSNAATLLQNMAMDDGATTSEIAVNFKPVGTSSSLTIRNKPRGGIIATTNTTSSDNNLFVENSGPHIKLTVGLGINAYIRSLDRGAEPFANSGAGTLLWILGDNVEEMNSGSTSTTYQVKKAQSLTSAGARTEIIGGAMDCVAADHASKSSGAFPPNRTNQADGTSNLYGVTDSGTRFAAVIGCTARKEQENWGNWGDWIDDTAQITGKTLTVLDAIQAAPGVPASLGDMKYEKASAGGRRFYLPLYWPLP